MRTPFHSETEAFRFLLVTVAALAAISAAFLVGGAVVGVVVWVVLTLAVAFLYLWPRRTRHLRTAPPHVGAPDERRVLVLADRVFAPSALVDRIPPTGGRTFVLVVYPARTSAVRHWASDVDGARARAEGELEECIVGLRAEGIDAWGEIGDEDPLQALEDALRTFGADEVVVATGAGDDTWVERARERFAVPIQVVAIDVDVAAAVS